MVCGGRGWTRTRLDEAASGRVWWLCVGKIDAITAVLNFHQLYLQSSLDNVPCSIHIPVAKPLTLTTSLNAVFWTWLIKLLQCSIVILLHDSISQSHSVSCVLGPLLRMSDFIMDHIHSIGFISGDSAGVLMVATPCSLM